MDRIALPPNRMNLSGARFGRLLCLHPAQIRKRHVIYFCECACGQTINVSHSNLRSGHTQSCGCLCREATRAANKMHGMSGRLLYGVWRQMVQRCTKDYAPNYKFYGGRGIAVDPRWLSFENFIADMGEPSTGMSIDRIDCNGPYAKWNCRWATKTQQSCNTRSNVFLTHDGKTFHLSEWERRLGLGKDVIGKRLRRGWPIEMALMSSNKEVTS